MLEASWESFGGLLGLGEEIADVGVVEMVLRTVVVYCAAVVLVRLAAGDYWPSPALSTSSSRSCWAPS